jgi:hypothetical protein
MLVVHSVDKLVCCVVDRSERLSVEQKGVLKVEQSEYKTVDHWAIQMVVYWGGHSVELTGRNSVACWVEMTAKLQAASRDVLKGLHWTAMWDYWLGPRWVDLMD